MRVTDADAADDADDDAGVSVDMSRSGVGSAGGLPFGKSLAQEFEWRQRRFAWAGSGAAAAGVPRKSRSTTPVLAAAATPATLLHTNNNKVFCVCV